MTILFALIPACGATESRPVLISTLGEVCQLIVVVMTTVLIPDSLWLPELLLGCGMLLCLN